MNSITNRTVIVPLVVTAIVALTLTAFVLWCVSSPAPSQSSGTYLGQANPTREDD